MFARASTYACEGVPGLIFIYKSFAVSMLPAYAALLFAQFDTLAELFSLPSPEGARIFSNFGWPDFVKSFLLIVRRYFLR